MTRPLLVVVLIALIGMSRAIQAQEAVMEEVRIDGSFSHSLELPADRAIDLFTARLRAGDEGRRALELQLANRSVITSLLSLTSSIPIPLGGSENRIDTFLLLNYSRADLNPRKGSPLFQVK